jgi:hypothetical protein
LTAFLFSRSPCIHKLISNTLTQTLYVYLRLSCVCALTLSQASCLSLAFPEYAIVVESIRDCWEAVVIYEFLRLILAYCGGESACLTVIMKNPGEITHLFPLNLCFRPIQLDSHFMRFTKRCVCVCVCVCVSVYVCVCMCPVSDCVSICLSVSLWFRLGLYVSVFV